MYEVTYKQKNAFSMLELVFVIVVLGIVSSIGAELIAKVYESYIVERATHRSSLKTELAATQIANRLAYAIPGTVIGRKGTTYVGTDHLDAKDYTILQWIGYDNDSFSAERVPGWSGFADIGPEATLTDDTIPQLSTPGSALGTTNTIIGSLGGGDITNAAIFFPSTFTVNNIGYGGTGGTSGAFPVTSGVGELLGVALTGKTIQEHYKLAWSSYAIVPLLRDGTTACTPDVVSNQICDLHLYYNFQPWKGEAYTAGLHEILVRNVSVFRFTGSSNTIRFKICQQEKISSTYKITICKEKTVIR